MTKFLMNLFAIPILTGLQILVMINGWGLNPESWAWIIGVGMFGNILVHILVIVGNKEK